MHGRHLGTALTLVAASMVLGLPAPARAALLPTTFGSTGLEQQYIVPPGAAKVIVHAVGGEGGCRYSGHPYGGDVTASLAVTPGQVLYVEVGGNGGPSNSSTPEIPVTGGFNGGGTGGPAALEGGAGGGGASDVRSSPRTAAGSLDTRLVVAGGGGGGGGANAGCLNSSGTAEVGGTATPTSGGAAGTTTYGCGAAVAGTQGTGGAGGGDSFCPAGGGGGGGGLFGGGGGGGGQYAGAAGGAGSSGAPADPHAVIALDTTGVPQVQITPLAPEAAPTPAGLAFPIETLGTSPSRLAVTVGNPGTAPLVVSGVHVAGPQAEDFTSPSSTCGVAVPPQGSCAVYVDFAPQAAGTRSATLLLTTNTAAGLLSVPLSGTAVSNAFDFAKVTHDATKGTAKLTIAVPGPGRLKLSGAGVKPISRDVPGSRGVLTVRPTPKVRAALELSGHRQVRVKVTYTPTGGDPRSRKKWVRLVLE